jgi:hypothetical protein
MRSAALLVLLGLALPGCATGTPAGAHSVGSQAPFRPYTRGAARRVVPPAPAPAPAELAATPRANREEIAARARALVGHKSVTVDGQRYPDDCTGLIRGVFAPAGLDVLAAARPGDNAVTAIYRYAQRHGRVFEGGWPLEGDLVFFRETYDLNRDGRRNDGLTHIGIVDQVREDGTVTVIHRVGRGVVRYRMNLKHPAARVHPDSGQVVNDYLRGPGAGAQRRLTGELFVAFATLLPPAPPPTSASR